MKHDGFVKLKDVEVKTLSDDLSEISEQDLVFQNNRMVDLKKVLRRYMDDIDTDIIGIKEELRKRKEKQQVEMRLRGAYTKE
jgi:hypothetical protein